MFIRRLFDDPQHSGFCRGWRGEGERSSAVAPQYQPFSATWRPEVSGNYVIIAMASEADASLSIIGYVTTSGRTKRFDDWIGFSFEVN